MSRTTTYGAITYSRALTTKPTASACDVTVMNRLTNATAATAPRATNVMTRADSAALAVRKVSQTVTSWMAITADCAQPVTNETETR